MRLLLGIALVMVLTVGAMAAGAGIYKWLESTDTQTNAQEVTEAPTPTPQHYQNLTRDAVDRLLGQYIDLPDSPGLGCLYRRISKRIKLAFLDGPELSEMVLNSVDTFYSRPRDVWVVRATGGTCKGIESWLISDTDGAISYVGGTLAPSEKD